jgi:hypothetical protein
MSRNNRKFFNYLQSLIFYDIHNDSVAPPRSQSNTDHVRCAQPQQNDSISFLKNTEYRPPLNLCPIPRGLRW